MDSKKSKNSSASLKSENEQDYKVTSSNADISNIVIFNISCNEKNMKDNLNGLKNDFNYLSKRKSSKSFSSIKNKENNEEKILDNNNDKKRNDIHFKKELKRQNNEYNIFYIKKNKFKDKSKINLNNINKTHSRLNKKSNNVYESVFKNNLRNKQITPHKSRNAIGHKRNLETDFNVNIKKDNNRIINLNHKNKKLIKNK